MRLGDGAAAAGQLGVGRDSEALLNALRPFCMSAMMTLEGMLHSESERAGGGFYPQDAARSTESNAVAVQIAAGRRLEAALTSLHSALVGIASLSRPSTGRSPGLGSALAPVLPYLMLPLQLALAPAKDANSSRGGGGGHGGDIGVKRRDGRGEGGGKGGKVSVRMPAAVREKALMCVTAAVRASGSRFVEGYGVRPTINVLIGLVFTMSECSPTGAPSPSPVHAEKEPQRGRAGGRDTHDRDSGAGKNGSDSGSGLTASTDALRLACLECLEALMRAPFDHPRSSATASSRPGAGPCAWSEVRDVLRNAVRGGIMAQLVQGLLLCCCHGDGGASAGAAASRGGEESWGGLETARLAAKCLDALSSFASGASTWRRFLPGTFSGLFRAIRGLEMGSGTEQTSAPRLTSIWLAASTTAVTSGGKGFQASSRGGGGSGASKSVVAETCLSVLTKVLLMCAGKDPDVAADSISMLPRSSPSRAVANSGSSGEDVAADGRATKNSENPLLVLERMTTMSNARAGRAGRAKGSNDDTKSESDRGSPSKPTLVAKAMATVPGSLSKASSAKAAATSPEDPGWEAQTSDRLRILLPPLLAMCRLHPGWRVRRASAAFASALLTGSRGDNGNEEVEWRSSAEKLGGEGIVPKEGLLGPLVPLLIEALIGLAMDDMPQVSTAAHLGIDYFRSTLSPLRWLALRGLLLDRLCAIVEGLPAVAKSADEKRLRVAFDLLAGYLSLLKFDARAALDARLPTVLSCLCEALEFDHNFNVQMLEGSHDTRTLTEVDRRQNANTESDGVKIVSGAEKHRDGIPGGAIPKYYRRVLANVREDATAASARRAVRLLGTYCDLASVGDAILSSLEIRYPRRQRHRPSRWHSSRRPSAAASTASASEVGHPVAHAQLQQQQRVVASVNGDDDNGVYQKRCLEWLRPRLPMTWVLNQALLGRVPGVAEAEPAAATAAATTNTRGDGGSVGGGEGSGAKGFLGRGLATDLLERLLASRAFSLPVTWAETTAVGNDDYFGGKGGMVTSNGSPGQGALLPGQGRVGDSIGFTRSGELLGGDRKSRVPGFSGQVLDANATLVSTVIEALASLAEASGPGFGEAFLRRALYPLLDKVASGHPVVSQAALATLWRARSACGKFDNMSQLLELNMDYVVDDVIRRVATKGASSRLRGRAGGGAVTIYGGDLGGSADGGVPGVVEAVLRIGGSAMGPALVRDLAGVTLREVDACAWDPRQTRRSLGVLRAVASCVSIPSLSNDVKREKDSSGEKRSSQIQPLAAKTEAENSGTLPSADESKASGCAVSSTLAKSPWFRQLFAEFAEPTDVGRAREQGGPEIEGLLEAFQEHQQAMGFDEDFSQDFDVGGDAKEEDEKEYLPEPDEEGRKMAETQEVKTLSEVLSRSCHFLATPSLQTQALALTCMRDCVLKLASAGADTALLPHVHRAWRPLMASFREHLTPLPTSPPPSVAGLGDRGEFEESLSYRRAVLLHSLDTVDALVEVCGDFLSTKVSEDLWPLLKVLLLQYTTSTKSGERKGRTSSSSSNRNAVSSTGGGYLLGNNLTALSPDPSPHSSDVSLANALGTIVTARSPSTPLAPSISPGSLDGGVAARGRISLDEKVVVRALECLEGLCRSEQCERFMTPLAREVAITALPCLSSSRSDAVCSSAEALFRRLAFLDGDSVWLLLLQTMDAAAVTRGDIRRHGGIRPPSRSDGLGPIRGGRASSRSGLGLGGRSSREAGLKRSQVDESGTRVALLATENCLSHFSAVSSALKREPPCMLAERKSVFDGVKVASEYAPAARRLLGALNAINPAAEHM